MLLFAPLCIAQSPEPRPRNLVLRTFMSRDSNVALAADDTTFTGERVTTVFGAALSGDYRLYRDAERTLGATGSVLRTYNAESNLHDFNLTSFAPGLVARKVFEALAEMCDYKAKRPAGRALGISITERSGSLGAGAVEASLDRKTGKVRVHKVWVAVDGGIIVQPEQARHNVESAILYGLSSVLHERVTIREGKVQQTNFHDYKLMRMSDVPEEIQVKFVDVDTRPTGLGEIGNPFIAPAIANAVYRLSGKRLEHLPFTPDKVLAALKV